MCLPDLSGGYIIVVAARSAVFDRKVKSTDVYEKMYAGLKKLGALKQASGNTENLK